MMRPVFIRVPGFDARQMMVTLTPQLLRADLIYAVVGGPAAMSAVAVFMGAQVIVGVEPKDLINKIEVALAEEFEREGARERERSRLVLLNTCAGPDAG